ncbi:5-oxoprolinase/urea amidolyase family protein [Microbacterium sp. zg-Y818]|uniref:5-oxoprolinase subunit B/C family protein n=1 Tax=unclassified Microbacterium TaxID=2609290 RepID=UPI00214CDF93|nr:MULTISPECIES: 5-oxoprolinase/urea amidolyase family protein [unclassified Microbacterium]MCR2802216.1 5-oxoprolinase/urea amidolyase family protein [Microbacterium sp. zg.Y818]WIM22759.1 5-oxoprolinase/urea amidolyase family protein [Microbacterium sp. zg-Y818]
MSPPRILPFGRAALLAEVDSPSAARDLHARLHASRPAGVVDVVPAARTVLVQVDPAVLSLAAARTWIAHAPPAPTATVDAGEVVVPIRYDGPDLAETAEALGVTVDEVVRRHREARWTVAFTGFAPGFGYLVSDDWPFDVPRLPTPRTRVPAGSVGLAGGFSGAYPRATPGGWRIIGHTDATLFDPAAASPVLLTPGRRVRFAPAAPAPSLKPHPVAETAETSPRLGRQMRSHGEPAAVEVVAPGPLATLQDLGRPGHAAEGIARSGAADRGALRTANRLVGGDERAAAIEVTMGGCRLRAARDLVAVVTGAWGPIAVAGRAVDPYVPFPWPAGEELHVERFTAGARAYLAVRGGFDGPRVAGSRSTDVLAGLGPAPLAAGDVLALAADAAGDIPPLDLHPWGPPPAGVLELDLAPGPRADWFAPTALHTLYETTWTVTADADRVGIRLDGPALARLRSGELPSEAMVPGALQVPPGGRPTILGVDGPVTGGYPVIAVATDAALDALAQALPGRQVRFRHARPVR